MQPVGVCVESNRLLRSFRKRSPMRPFTLIPAAAFLLTSVVPSLAQQTSATQRRAKQRSAGTGHRQSEKKRRGGSHLRTPRKGGKPQKRTGGASRSENFTGHPGGHRHRPHRRGTRRQTARLGAVPRGNGEARTLADLGRSGRSCPA